ncbi:hypothetical protein GWI33_012124, partial [Rhynchophorus ferrugineus]
RGYRLEEKSYKKPQENKQD